MDPLQVLNPASTTLECSFSNPVFSDGSSASTTLPGGMITGDPWNFASSTCAINLNATTTTSTPTIVNTISGGELIIAAMEFSLLIFFLLFTFTIWRRGIRIRQ